MSGSNMRVIERLRAEKSSLGPYLAASVEAWERRNEKPYPDGVTYPGFCRHPEKCGEARRCTAEWSCVD